MVLGFVPAGSVSLPAGTKPRTSHHRSPGEERRGKRKR